MYGTINVRYDLVLRISYGTRIDGGNSKRGIIVITRKKCERVISNTILKVSHIKWDQI